MYIRRPSDIGALVRAGRTARGLKQDDLAEMLGVSRWWVNEFEKGKSTARLDLVLRALNELQFVIEAHPAGAGQETPPPELGKPNETGKRPNRGGFDSGAFASDAFEIDAIANTGLASAPGATTPAKKAKTRKAVPKKRKA